MKTDKLFHELFQIAPLLPLHLVNITPQCDYQFVSPTVKASERRMDGLLEPSDPNCPRYFIEIQGYNDKSIYWRAIHQIGIYHEQNPKYNGSEWRALFLFLDKSHDPKPTTLGTLYDENNRWLIRGHINDLLLQNTAMLPELNVLRPLTAPDAEAVRKDAREWSDEIRHAPQHSQATKMNLLRLMGQFILQKFIHFSNEELEQMMGLAPFEETRVAKEFMAQGAAIGYKQGVFDMVTAQIKGKFGIPKHSAEKLLDGYSEAALTSLGLQLLGMTDDLEFYQWLDDNPIVDEQ